MYISYHYVHVNAMHLCSFFKYFWHLQTLISWCTFWIRLKPCLWGQLINLSVTKVGWLLLFTAFYVYIIVISLFILCHFQMVGCRTRGFSFTRALLGICADELHLCGDAAAVPLIEEILKETGDVIQVLTFDHATVSFCSICFTCVASLSRIWAFVLN